MTVEGKRSVTSQSKFLRDAPPLMLTLTSTNYRIKWTWLAELPAPLYSGNVAVQDSKIFISNFDGPVKDTCYRTYVYEIDNNRWGQLPSPDHYSAVPHIIGGKLALIGGCLIATDKRTNKVSTFDQAKQSWVSHYPNLLSVRNQPGVVTHTKYVIVAGGGKGDDGDAPVVLDDIEILDWVENSQWKRASILLPVPMYSLQLTVCNDRIFVVGYSNADMYYDRHVYELPVTVIINSVDQQCASTRWVGLGETTYWCSCLINGLFPLTVVGGSDVTHATTADINMYDRITGKWKKIDSLSFARCRTAVTAIGNNSVIVIGGCTSVNHAESSSLTIVELGQVKEA